MVGTTEVKGPKMAQEWAAALAEIELLRADNERLRGLLGLTDDRQAEPPVAWEPTLFVPAVPPRPVVDRRSSAADKIGLFRSLFAGRDDVYAVRWQNDRSGKSGWSPAVVGGWANAKRPDREYEVLTDAVIERHLAGDVSAGVYPLLRNDRCRLLACDFDGGRGPSTRSPTSTRAGSPGYRPCWNAHALVMAGTCGCSSPVRSWLPMRAKWARRCCDGRWHLGSRSTCRATTGCSRRRT